MIHGDSVYDIIDKQDHQAIQTELVRNATGPGDEERMFLCRMNVSRNARRQMRFGDQKVGLSTHFVQSVVKETHEFTEFKCLISKTVIFRQHIVNTITRCRPDFERLHSNVHPHNVFMEYTFNIIFFSFHILQVIFLEVL